VRCDRNPEGKDSTDPRVKYFDSNVYAGMINFGPQQNQLNEFGDALPTVVNPDILLVKLRPGQVSCIPS
jgi:DNA-directed RNA polymerase I and III subunit RPAC1